jgi:molecular chaperone GrpE
MTEIDGDAPEPATGTPDPDGETVTAAIARLQADVERLTDQWRRALADLDNTRKRAARESASARADERARVAREWLPVLDNLDRALEHGRSDPGTILEGVEAVRQQALSVLERLGFPRRADLGTPFDPARHEAVAAAPDPDAAPGTVVQVVRPAYGEGERQLRPASVVVATGAE